MEAGSSNSVQLGFVPLDSRGPSWLAVPAGVIAGGAGSTAIAGGAVMALGALFSPEVLMGAAGFLVFTLALTLILSPRRQWSFPALMSNLLGIGHGLLLVAFLVATQWPPAFEKAQTLLESISWMPPLPETSNPFLILGPIYIAAFTAYSVFAPVSLIILRYIGLTNQTRS